LKCCILSGCFPAKQIIEILHTILLFLTSHNLYCGQCLEILIISDSSTFISIPHYIPFPLNLSTMACSTLSCLVSNICIFCRANYLFSYFEVSEIFWILLGKALSVQAEQIGDRHHPRLTSRPILTLLASPWSIFILTALSMYSLVSGFLAS